jgi:type IV pilus assembly protein PilB
MPRQKLGEILLEANVINDAQLEKAVKERETSTKPIGKILIDLGFATEETIAQGLSRQMNIPMVHLSDMTIDTKTAELVPGEMCLKKRLIPIRLDKNELLTAMHNPTDYGAMDEVSFITGYRVKPVVALEKDILDTLIRLNPPMENLEAENPEGVYFGDTLQVIRDTEPLDDRSLRMLEKSAKGAVVVRLTNTIISNAVKRKASDIHIEPQEKEVAVRYRIDGLLQDIMTFGKTAQAAVISRIKIMAGLDITLQRKPQDGRTRVKIGDNMYDLRVSSLPTLFGEKLVLRILEARVPVPLSGIGLGEKELNQFKEILKMPQGMILVTGPTGSGKTTTLYTAIQFLFSPEVNIVTIEDPIEYSIPGINQVQVNPATGLSFADGLRSLLRQDPNIVMVGEIRDKETADIAFRAAQTGHLVLTTLHTNYASSAVVRLVDIGVEPYIISSSLLCVIAQRLVRKLCTTCSAFARVEPKMLDKFPVSKADVFKIGKGCAECQFLGYKGRIGIFEFLPIDRTIKELIHKRVSDSEIMDAAKNAGMVSITEDGFFKAKQGITSLSEVLRAAPPPEPQPAIEPDKEDIIPVPAPDDTVSAPPKMDPTPPQSIRKERIMVVDDDDAVRVYLTSILEAEFFDVIQAVDGVDAMEKIFKEDPPDLIIIDYYMPSIDGLQLIEKLNANRHTRNIPTIMLTAVGTEKTEVQALNAGADDWINKPVNGPRLIARIKRLLRKE